MKRSRKTFYHSSNDSQRSELFQSNYFLAQLIESSVQIIVNHCVSILYFTFKPKVFKSFSVTFPRYTFIYFCFFFSASRIWNVTISLELPEIKFKDDVVDFGQFRSNHFYLNIIHIHKEKREHYGFYNFHEIQLWIKWWI